MSQLQQFQVPNFAAAILQGRESRAAAGAARNKAALETRKFEAGQAENKRKFEAEQEKDKIDFVERVFSAVDSDNPDDFHRAGQIVLSRYPDEANSLDLLFPQGYDKGKLELFQKSLLSTKDQMKLQGFSPGTTIFKGGEEMKTLEPKTPTPPTPSYELFVDDKGQQAYLEKGAKVPEGWSRADKKAGGGVTINMPKAAPASERESLNKLFTFESQLGRIEELYDPKFVGRAEGPLGAVKEATGVGASARESEFRQVINDISDTLLRLRSGAQINEQEYKRMRKLVPTSNLPEKVFNARLKSLKTSIADAIKTRRGTMEESGFIAPSGDTGVGDGVTLKFDAQGNMVE